MIYENCFVVINEVKQSEKQKAASAEFNGFSCTCMMSIVGKDEDTLSGAAKILAIAKRLRASETINFVEVVKDLPDAEKLPFLQKELTGAKVPANVYKLLFSDLLKGTEFEGKTIFDVNGNEQFMRQYVDLFGVGKPDDIVNAAKRWLLNRIEKGKFLTEKPQA